MPPFTNICKYKERCPSSTAWCLNQQPSKKCIPFLETHLDLVNQDLNNTLDLINSIKEKDVRLNKSNGNNKCATIRRNRMQQAREIQNKLRNTPLAEREELMPAPPKISR